MKSKWKRFNRCDQHANLHYSPPLNGYEQVVEFIMRVARENWKNADELDLVEDLWRSKLFDAGVIPYRKNESPYLRWGRKNPQENSVNVRLTDGSGFTNRQLSRSQMRDVMRAIFLYNIF